MFKFKEQKIFDVGGVKVGGQPGQLPTVLIGSIFYEGHKIVKDRVKGIFDEEAAENLLKMEEEASAKTGNPRIIDVVISYPENIAKYIDFVADATDAPFLIDGANAEIRVAAARHVYETGLINRVVYNTIGADVKPEEIEAIKKHGIKSAVVLAFNRRMPTIQGRIEVLKGTSGKKGLLEMAREAGIKNVLVDVSVLDVPDVGPASRAIYLVKKEFGLPAGCAPANAIDTWKRSRKMDPKIFMVSNTSLHGSPVMMGADFILYGPMSRAPEIYQAVAASDALVAYTMIQQYRIRPLTRDHPLYKIF